MTALRRGCRDRRRRRWRGVCRPQRRASGREHARGDHHNARRQCALRERLRPAWRRREPDVRAARRAPPVEAAQMARAQAMAGRQFAALREQAPPRRAVLQPAARQRRRERRHVPRRVVFGVAQATAQVRREDEIPDAQSRRDGLRQPREVDHPLWRERRERRRGVLRQQAVDVLLDDRHVPAAGDGHQLSATLQAHGRRRRVVQGRRQNGQASASSTGLRKRPGQDALAVHRNRVEATAQVARDGVEPRVDQGLANDLVELPTQAQRRVHRVLRAGAHQDGVGFGLDTPPAKPGRCGLPVEKRVARPRVVQEASGVARSEPGAPRRRSGRPCVRRRGEGRREIAVTRRHRGHVGRQIDDAPLRALLQGEDRRFRRGREHVGAAAHLAADQAPPRGLPVGPRRGADVDAEQIGQQPVRGQQFAWTELSQPNGIGDGVGDREVGRPGRCRQVRQPDCHAHNLPFRAYKIAAIIDAARPRRGRTEDSWVVSISTARTSS